MFSAKNYDNVLVVKIFKYNLKALTFPAFVCVWFM